MKTNRIISNILTAGVIAALSFSCSVDGFDYGPDNGRHRGREREREREKGNTGSSDYLLAVSGGSGGGGGNSPSTRAILDLDNPTVDRKFPYRWEEDDPVKFYATEAGNASNIILNGKTLTAKEGDTAHTTFYGEVTDPEIAAMRTAATLDYYSYYLPNSSVGGTFPNITFSTPSSIDISKANKFYPEYAPMVAVMKGQPATLYLKSGWDDLDHDDLIHFNYNHVMSYAAFEMDVDLLGVSIPSITITNNNGQAIAGTVSVNLTATPNPSVSISGSSTITITGGMRPEQGQVIYIPMPPMDMSTHTFTVSFGGLSGNPTYRNVTIPGTNFQRGEIHKLRVAPSIVFTESDEFPLLKSGSYYIEVWGGDGGNGGNVGGTGSDTKGAIGAGGKGLRQAGLFNLNAGALYIQIGEAGGVGGNGISSGLYTNTPGGVGGSGGSGTWFGSGHQGGQGGNSPSNGFSAANSGSGGGGGGAASGVLLDDPLVLSNILIASGGGGGGGGNSDQPGGVGGSSGIAGSKSTGNDGGNGAGGTTWNDSSTNGDGVNSGSINGATGGVARRADGGGGGGGGGFNGTNGGGGRSGNGGGGGGNVKSGGGGAGGKSYTQLEALIEPPASVKKTDDRPDGRRDGYVVITFLRPTSQP